MYIVVPKSIFIVFLGTISYIHILYMCICRVKEACSVLEAITKLESLDDYLDTLTPEWLKSLILHSPLSHGHDVTRIVENADSCLTLLKVCILLLQSLCPRSGYPLLFLWHFRNNNWGGKIGKSNKL